MLSHIESYYSMLSHIEPTQTDAGVAVPLPGHPALPAVTGSGGARTVSANHYRVITGDTIIMSSYKGIKE